MLARLGNLLLLDAKLLWRNKFVHVVLVLAVIFILVVNFLLPGELKLGVTEYVHDGTTGRVFGDWLAENGRPGAVKYAEEELRRAVEENPSSVGVILKGSRDNPQTVLIQQGHEPPSAIGLLEVSVDALWRQNTGLEAKEFHSVSYLRPKAGPVDFNLSTLPVFISLEVILLGFIFAAVMVFQEKSDGTIQAYRLTPGGAVEYILSKLLVNIGLSLLYGLLVVGATLQGEARYDQFVLLIIVSGSLMTLLGMGIGVFFNSLSGFLYPAVLVMIPLGLPLGAYFFPAFNPDFFQYIPTYQALFGFREIFFPTGRPDLFHKVLGFLVPQLLAAGLFCFLVVRKRLLREVA